MSCPHLPGYLEELQRLGRGAHTLTQTRRWVEEYWRSCQVEGVAELGQLRPDHLERFIQSRLGQPKNSGGLLSTRSIYVAQQYVRGFLRWAWSCGHMRQNLNQDAALTRSLRSTPEALTLAELQRVLAQPEALHAALARRDRALLEVICRAGLSRNQVHRLDLADVQLRARTLRVGRDTRLLTEPLAEAMARYLWEGRPLLNPQPNENAVFLALAGQRLDKAAITELVRSYGDRAGLRALTTLSLAQPPRI